jgi:hypothetical protein
MDSLAFLIFTLDIVILCQQLNSLPEFFVRSIQFRVRDFELVVFVGQDCELSL